MVYIKMIFCFLAVLTICWKTSAIKNISTHHFPKFMGGFLLLQLALIAFLFGIHAEIFSSYDKLNSKTKPSYSWFLPEHIIKFPIEQLGISRDIFPKCEINLDSAFAKTPQTKKITIVIDKTKSTAKTASTLLFSKKLIDSIQLYLSNNTDQNEINFKNISLEDLFVLNALERLARDHTKTIKFQLMYYLGDQKILSPYPEDKLLNNETLIEISTHFVKYVQQTVNPEVDKMKKTTVTDFRFIADKLNQPNWCGSDSTSCASLVIFSDFEHEEKSGISFQSMAQSLEKLSEKKITQVNLIKLNGKNQFPEWSAKTLSIFRATFSHLYYYEFKEQLRDGEGNHDLTYSEQIASIFSSANDEKTPQPVILYYSWDNENFSYDYKGVVAIKGKKKDLIASFSNKVNDIDLNEKTSYILFKQKRHKQYPQKKSKINFNSSDPDTLLFKTNQRDANDYYLELNYPGSTTTIREPIILRQVLPTTSSIYLIYLYTLCCLGIISLVLYYIFCLYTDQKSGDFYNAKSVLTIVILVFFSVLCVSTVSKVWANFESLFYIFSVGETFVFSFFLISTLAIYSFLFIHSKAQV